MTMRLSSQVWGLVFFPCPIRFFGKSNKRFLDLLYVIFYGFVFFFLVRFCIVGTLLFLHTPFSALKYLWTKLLPGFRHHPWLYTAGTILATFL